MTKLGTADVTENFAINGSNFDSNKIEISIGEVNYGLLPSLNLNYKRSTRFFISMGILSSVASGKKEYLFLKEAKDFFLTRSSEKVLMSDNKFTIEKNSLLNSGSNSVFKNFSMFGFIGLRLGLK